jgi:hypothetical protein
MRSPCNKSRSFDRWGGWHVVGAGDFTGDGKADLVLENTATGVRVIWILDNGNFDHTVNLGTVPSSWHIVGVGDFPGNGQSDLVWENTMTGQRVLRTLKAGNLQNATVLSTISTTWHAVNH